MRDSSFAVHVVLEQLHVRKHSRLAMVNVNK